MDDKTCRHSGFNEDNPFSLSSFRGFRHHRISSKAGHRLFEALKTGHEMGIGHRNPLLGKGLETEELVSSQQDGLESIDYGNPKEFRNDETSVMENSLILAPILGNRTSAIFPRQRFLRWNAPRRIPERQFSGCMRATWCPWFPAASISLRFGW
jgi:hypothetical protein